MIKPVPHVAAMSTYALAELNPPSGKRLVSLSQNESLLPPSPLAIATAAKAMSNAQLYPDPDWSALRKALADLHDIPAEQILCALHTSPFVSAGELVLGSTARHVPASQFTQPVSLVREPTDSVH